jgi:DNA end-binding protein Ku
MRSQKAKREAPRRAARAWHELIEKMFSPDFEPERYADEYRERARSMVEQKVKGQKSKPSPRRSQVVDIFAALKKSLETAGRPQQKGADRIKQKQG